MKKFYLHMLPDRDLDVLGGNGPLETYKGAYDSLEAAKAKYASFGGHGRAQIVGLTSDRQLKGVAFARGSGFVDGEWVVRVNEWVDWND